MAWSCEKAAVLQVKASYKLSEDFKKGPAKPKKAKKPAAAKPKKVCRPHLRHDLYSRAQRWLALLCL